MNPNCPKCGAKMTEKHNNRTGAPFWGCTAYPKCTGIIPFRENKNFGIKIIGGPNSRPKPVGYIRGKSQRYYNRDRSLEDYDDYEDDLAFPGNPDDYGDS